MWASIRTVSKQLWVWQWTQKYILASFTYNSSIPLFPVIYLNLRLCKIIFSWMLLLETLAHIKICKSVTVMHKFTHMYIYIYIYIHWKKKKRQKKKRQKFRPYFFKKSQTITYPKMPKSKASRHFVNVLI